VIIKSNADFFGEIQMITDRNSPFKLGITGGIGSGKTSVCRVFDVLGIPVFSADREASEIMETESEIKSQLNSITGKDLYRGGSLDRMLLADIIFNDDAALEKVNSLIHPKVSDNFMRWAIVQESQYVIMEAAILFESGASAFVDRIATVVAPVNERVDRVIQRNMLTKEQVMVRIKKQMDDETRMKLSDYIIYNSENDMIIPAILKIHDDILTIINNNT
jgi:dephospho-CoA kinase